MKTLLVPTDFSETAANALRYAIAFARRNNSKLILLHSAELDYKTLLYTLVVPAEDSFRKQAMQQLQEMAVVVKQREGLECEAIMKDSSLSEAILTTADEKKADLIIMGTKGAHGLKKILAGSHTAEIIEQARFPVLAIPDRAHFKEIRTITFATEFHEGDLRILAKLKQIATLFEAKIQILHISSLSELHDSVKKAEREYFCREALKTIGGDNLYFSDIESIHVSEQLHKFICEQECDMLVLNTKHRYVLEKVFDSSLSKELSYDTGVPVLVFHHAQQPFIL